MEDVGTPAWWAWLVVRVVVGVVVDWWVVREALRRRRR
jgi:hypothetical protein